MESDRGSGTRFQDPGTASYDPPEIVLISFAFSNEVCDCRFVTHRASLGLTNSLEQQDTLEHIATHGDAR